jgi:hypothetical protein
LRIRKTTIHEQASSREAHHVERTRCLYRAAAFPILSTTRHGIVCLNLLANPTKSLAALIASGLCRTDVDGGGQRLIVQIAGQIS